MKTLDYINVRDAQVHGLVNPTFIMYGNCSLKDYSFEVTVDGKKREARFLPDLASDNYELTLSLSKDDSKVKVYLIHDDQKELVCVRKNTLMKRIKSKIRTLLQKTVRKTKETNNKVKVNTYAIGKEVKYIAKEYHFVLTPNRLKQSKRRIKENKKTKNKFLDVYNFLNQKEYLLWLNPDSLLHFYRIEAGLPSKAAPYAGWESQDVWGAGPLRGGFLGFYLSSVSMMYQSTDDKRLLKR